MFIKSQIEDFVVPGNILYNLLPNENLIYKLKLKFYLKQQIIWILIIFLIVISLVLMILEFAISDFFKTYLMFFLVALLIIPFALI